MGKTKGFSLIELMVVTSIVAIMAIIAITLYLDHIAKSKRSEVKNNLGGIYRAEIAFYGEHSAYDNNFDMIGWQPEGRCFYSYSVGGSIKGKIPPDTLPVGTPFAGPSTFSAYGWGNIDNDPAVDVWHIDEQNNLSNDINDLSS